MGHTPLLLTKWYPDCVAENDDAVILYVADLSWNTLTIHYGSLLTVLGGRIGSTSSLRGGPPPRFRTGRSWSICLRWMLKVRGKG